MSGNEYTAEWKFSVKAKVVLCVNIYVYIFNLKEDKRNQFGT